MVARTSLGPRKRRRGRGRSRRRGWSGWVVRVLFGSGATTTMSRSSLKRGVMLSTGASRGGGQYRAHALQVNRHQVRLIHQKCLERFFWEPLDVVVQDELECFQHGRTDAETVQYVGDPAPTTDPPPQRQMLQRLVHLQGPDQLLHVTMTSKPFAPSTVFGQVRTFVPPQPQFDQLLFTQGRAHIVQCGGWWTWGHYYFSCCRLLMVRVGSTTPTTEVGPPGA